MKTNGITQSIWFPYFLSTRTSGASGSVHIYMKYNQGSLLCPNKYRLLSPGFVPLFQGLGTGKPPRVQKSSSDKHPKVAYLNCLNPLVCKNIKLKISWEQAACKASCTSRVQPGWKYCENSLCQGILELPFPGHAGTSGGALAARRTNNNKGGEGAEPQER